MDGEMYAKKGKCKMDGCMNEINLIKFTEKSEWIIPMCQECLNMENQKNAKDKADRNLMHHTALWMELCPDVYQESDMNHPTVQRNINGWQSILSWKREKTARCGILCIGAPGCAKSRAMWALMKRIFFELKPGLWNERNLPIKYFTETGLSGWITKLFSSKPDQGVEFIESLCNAPYLFIDDIGKASVTDRFSQSLFEIVEVRTSRMRPIFATANFTGIQLEKHLGDAGTPIVRRLREFCNVVNFE